MGRKRNEKPRLHKAHRHPQRWHESLLSSLHDSCRWTAPLFLRSTGAVGMDFDGSAV